MNRAMLCGSTLLALLVVSVVGTATSYSWYPQSWTAATLHDSGSGHPMASGEIHYKVHNGLEVQPSVHLPTGLPGFSEFYWTGTPCEVRLDDDTSAPVYHLMEYDAVLRNTEGDEISSVYAGCPINGNPAGFSFSELPEDGVEYDAVLWFEEAGTGEQIAYTDTIEFGKPEVVETDPLGNMGFTNEYTAYECYRMCRYNPTMPFDNCAEYYGTPLGSRGDDNWYGYAMTWYFDHEYCTWSY